MFAIKSLLANQLKYVLPFVIDETQSAFGPGRIFLVNIRVAFETVHAMKLKSKGRKAM